ncbi:MAG: helix-hairpin-helix domain-containing protein, partial [Planctomycetota bacterium]
MTNEAIASVFEQMADLLEFKGENPFRIKAYRNGARSLRQLEEAAQKVLEDPDRKLSDLPGIGKTLVEKITVLVETGSLPQLKKLQEEIPASVLQMVRIPGLGAKKAAALHAELGIETLEQLRDACLNDSVSALKGFGKKTQETILDGLEIAEAAAKRKYWWNADQL